MVGTSSSQLRTLRNHDMTPGFPQHPHLTSSFQEVRWKRLGQGDTVCIDFPPCPWYLKINRDILYLWTRLDLRISLRFAFRQPILMNWLAVACNIKSIFHPLARQRNGAEKYVCTCSTFHFKGILIIRRMIPLFIIDSNITGNAKQISALFSKGKRSL